MVSTSSNTFSFWWRVLITAVFIVIYHLHYYHQKKLSGACTALGVWIFTIKRPVRQQTALFINQTSLVNQVHPIKRLCRDHVYILPSNLVSIELLTTTHRPTRSSYLFNDIFHQFQTLSQPQQCPKPPPATLAPDQTKAIARATSLESQANQIKGHFSGQMANLFNLHRLPREEMKIQLLASIEWCGRPTITSHLLRNFVQHTLYGMACCSHSFIVTCYFSCIIPGSMAGGRVGIIQR